MLWGSTIPPFPFKGTLKGPFIIEEPPEAQEYAAFRGSDTTEAPLAAGAGSWLHFGSCLDFVGLGFRV